MTLFLSKPGHAECTKQLMTIQGSLNRPAQYYGDDEYYGDDGDDEYYGDDKLMAILR